MNLRLKYIQQLLNDRGYPCPITGMDNKEMKEAWYKFCEANSLPKDPVPRSADEAPYILLHSSTD